MVAFCACSNNEETTFFKQENSEIVFYAETFAFLHNDCLDYCYTNLNISTKAGKSFVSLDSFKEEITNLANMYVKIDTKGETNDDEVKFFSYDFINSISISEIRNMMSSTELSYIDQIISSSAENNQSINSIKEQILADNILSEEQKKCVYTFICVYEMKSVYWGENLEKWQGMAEKYIDGYAKTKAAGWIVADCYWGWFGTVSSGGNAIVGAGAAAVASVCMAI
ncbi:MAG: cell wall metabolism sensor histidine kinase WalK [Tannerellaceae bacterium]|nr:cell wall metabolism sensor histidine kinase WalK [Tannerellaceae bacterium]